ncbi:MAG: TetR/AcrR family transcriptional regulator [Oscillospiraceae bacterium]|nr:TetR/AcrR family transcriptional regulator [Oscillospiraceae bacterium]
MPKALSDIERNYIKNRLREEARESMIRHGIKKTTVDDIVRRVGIPKGTFYLFYESKELLLFDVFCALHDEYQAKIISEIRSIQGEINADNLTDVIFTLYKLMDHSEIARLMTGGEIEMLFRKLPPEISKRHAEQDDFRVEELVSMVPNISADNIEVFSAALRGVFLSILYKREVGEAVFDDALRIMVRGVVIQMFKGEQI